MSEHDIGAIPVGQNDWLIGMVTDRDIVCRGLTNSAAVTILKAHVMMPMRSSSRRR